MTNFAFVRTVGWPASDHAPHGPGTVFPDEDVDTIVGIWRSVRDNAIPKGGAA